MGPARATRRWPTARRRRAAGPSARPRRGCPGPAAASSPRSSMRRWPPEGEGDRRQQRQRPAERADLVPAPPVEAAGQPHHRPLGVVDLGPGHEVRGGRGEHRRDPDADQHEAVAGDPALGRTAGRWRWRRRSPPPSAPIVTWLAVPSRTTIVSTAQAAAPAVTPMMSGLASGLRAMRWKIAPDRPNAAPTRTAANPRGQPQRADDEVGVGPALPHQGGHHVPEGDREVAHGQRPGEHHEGNG